MSGFDVRFAVGSKKQFKIRHEIIMKEGDLREKSNASANRRKWIIGQQIFIEFELKE